MDESTKRALESGDCELIPQDRPVKDLYNEMNERSCKVGLTTKYGEPSRATRIMARGFGESKLNIWPRDENGQLVD